MSRSELKQRMRNLSGPIAVILLASGMPASMTRGEDASAANQNRVAEMSVAEKRDLLAKQERFNKLSNAKQDELRRLHQALDEHPDAEPLRQVLSRYVTWLSTLTVNEQATLQELPIDRRLTRIAELNRDRDDQRLRSLGLTVRDAEVVLDWFTSSVDANRESLLKALGQKQTSTKQNDPRSEMKLRMMLMRNSDKLLRLLPSGPLIAQLSDGAKERFLSLSERERQETLEVWVRAAFHHRFRPPPLSREELFRRLQQMPSEERARLEQLPPDELERVLRDLSGQWSRRRGRSPGFHRDRGRGPNRRSPRRPPPEEYHGPRPPPRPE